MNHIYELSLESQVSDEQWLALIEKTEIALGQLAIINPKAVEQREVGKASLAEAREIFVNGIPFEESGFAELARNWPNGQELPLSDFPEGNELIIKLSNAPVWDDDGHRVFDDLLDMNCDLYFKKANSFAEEKAGLDRLKETFAWTQTMSSCVDPNWLLVWIDYLIYECGWRESDNINARLAYIDEMESALATAMMEYTYDRQEIIESWQEFLKSRREKAATEMERQRIQIRLDRLAKLAEEKISHRSILNSLHDKRVHFKYGLKKHVIGLPTGEYEYLKFEFLTDHIYFDFGSYQISPKMTHILQVKAAFLFQYPSLKAEIHGHCDNIGPREYNLALGHLRAKAVYDELVALGIDASRLSIASYGSRKPLVPSATEAARARNRRVQFVITSE